MIELPLIDLPGTLVWSAPDAPAALTRASMPLGIGPAHSMTGQVRSYGLESLVPGERVQSMGHHGRSCYLGTDGKSHYFAKGVGWTIGTGWTPEHGNTGILPLWAALRERDVGQAVAALGIAVSSPVAIWELSAVPGPQGTLVAASDVPDLDGSPARPSVFVYRSRERWRLADLPFMGASERARVRDRFWDIIETLQQSVRVLHAHGGHDYSISLHNAWIDGARVDFEYVYLPQQPHPVAALNGNIASWQSKEQFALHELIFQLADLAGVEIPADALAERRARMMP
jgi:hypothetical protein